MKSSISHSDQGLTTAIALSSFAYFFIAVVALYFLNPAYSLTSSMAGNYDPGSYELLIASTFFSLALGSLALMPGLFHVMLPSVRSRIGLLLLGIWGMGIFLAGIFPANEGGSTVPHMTTVLIAGIFPVEVEAYPETAFSFMHILAILGSFLSLTFAAILLSWSFKQDERWRHFHPLSLILALILALVMLAALIFSIPLFFSQLSVLMSSFNIIFNPMFFALTGVMVGILWLILAAIRLRYVIIGSASKG